MENAQRYLCEIEHHYYGYKVIHTKVYLPEQIDID